MFKLKERKEKTENKKGILNSKIVFAILAVILIAIFCVAMTPVTLQNDTYYTIKIGEQITKTGIDMQDHFSWHDRYLCINMYIICDFRNFYIYSKYKDS